MRGLVARFAVWVALAPAAEVGGAEPTWREISAALVERIETQGSEIAWPGGTAGVAVDPATGAVFVVIPGQGIWRSTDQGTSFARVDGGKIGGRCETAFSLQFDPAGRRLACFQLDGACGMTPDGGDTWAAFRGLGRNWDYAAVDWSGREVRSIFAARHETGGEVFISHDAGQSWERVLVDPEFERTGALGIFDAETLVYGMKGRGIQRSTDGGRSWTHVSELEPRGRVVRVLGKAAYWIGPAGLLISEDRGATWRSHGAPVDASIGPYFDPRDPRRIAVAGARGIFESADGGETWKRVASLPEGFDLPKDGWYSNVAWDPGRGIYYASRMGRGTYKLETADASSPGVSTFGTRPQAGDWPQFRGPTGQGHVPTEGLPLEWGGSERRHVLWTAPLVGDGHASPIVVKGRVIVSTAAWDEEVTSQAERAKVIPAHHVICYSLESGERLWDTVVEPGPWRRDDFRSGAGGGYAAPTPATDGERVFVAFGSAVIAALDLDGLLLWRLPIEPYTFDVTLGSSPVVVDHTVVLLCAMAKRSDSRLLALDATKGTVRWETPLPETGFAHSTPLLIEAGGRRQLVVVASGIGETSRGIQAFDAASGALLWWCRGAGDAASAAFGAGVVYADSGRGGPGVAVDPTGAGDVTETRVRWRVEQVPEGIGSPVIFGEHVYRLHRPNVLQVWSARDGSKLSAKRLERLSSTWASPIVDAAGRLYVASAGVSYVLRASPDLEVLAINDLGDPNHASPAVAGDRMILVGTRQVYCIGGD